jgi:hypothetical protein
MSIAEELAAFDRKNRTFYDDMSDDEKKKFSAFMMIRWGATVQGSRELQEYYLASTNERLNKYFFDISSKEHAKLHWLLASTVSPGLGKQYHPWLGAKKKDAGSNKVRKFLEKHNSHMKPADLDVLEAVVTQEELIEMAVGYGYTPDQIKKELK